MQSKYYTCGIKKSRFVQEQEAKVLLSNLGIKAPLNEIPLFHVVFKKNWFYVQCLWFIYKNKEIIEKFMQTENTDFIYRNELDIACFQHNMAYGKSKDLTKRAQSDKVLRDREFKIASDTKYDGYQRGLASMVYKLFDKNYSRSGVANEPSYQMANKLHRQIIRKFKRRKVYSLFRHNT